MAATLGDINSSQRCRIAISDTSNGLPADSIPSSAMVVGVGWLVLKPKIRVAEAQ